MQVRCKNIPDGFKDIPDLFLKGPGAGKYGLGTLAREIGFRCCKTSIASQANTARFRWFPREEWWDSAHQSESALARLVQGQSLCRR